MKDLSKIRNDITIYINQYVNDVFNKIKEDTEQLTSVSLELKLEETKLDNIKEIYQNTINANRLEKGIVTREKESLSKDIDDFSRKFSKFNQEKTQWLSNLDVFKREINNLENKKLRLIKETSELEKLEKNKLDLISEIKDIRDNNKIDIEEYKDYIYKCNEDKVIIEKDIDNLKKTRREEESHILPTIKELNSKAKMLDQKERDLSVVEQRFKKLYEVHGASFRV